MMEKRRHRSWVWESKISEGDKMTSKMNEKNNAYDAWKLK